MDSVRSKFGPNQYSWTLWRASAGGVYDARHPLTRTGTREARMRVMRVATDAGLVLGVEGPPQDYTLGLAPTMTSTPFASVSMCLCTPSCTTSVPRSTVSTAIRTTTAWITTARPRRLAGQVPARAALWDQSSLDRLQPRLLRMAEDIQGHQRRACPTASPAGSGRDAGPPVPDARPARAAHGLQLGGRGHGQLWRVPFQTRDQKELPAYGYRVKDSRAGGRSYSGRIETGIAVQD